MVGYYEPELWKEKQLYVNRPIKMSDELAEKGEKSSILCLTPVIDAWFQNFRLWPEIELRALAGQVKLY